MAAQKLLIVEDDTFKSDRICDCLTRLSETPVITLVTSVQAAVAILAERCFDVVLLDMALPSHQAHPGGAPASSLLSGGIEIIMELSFLNRREKVIVITQYPEIEIEGVLVPVEHAEAAFKKMCNINLTGVVHYKHEEKVWETSLITALRN